MRGGAAKLALTLRLINCQSCRWPVIHVSSRTYLLARMVCESIALLDALSRVRYVVELREVGHVFAPVHIAIVQSHRFKIA